MFSCPGEKVCDVFAYLFIIASYPNTFNVISSGDSRIKSMWMSSIEGSQLIL